MTTLNVQDRSTLRTHQLVVAMSGPRIEILAYVARTYPHLHVVSFKEI